jgi:uncharacterized membrane protein YfcA
MDLHPRLLALICERAMDVTAFQLSLFLSAAFVAAFVAGVSGFAFALIAAAVWLHILSPLETATLIIGYGLIVQGYGFWKLRHAFSWNRLWPFIIAGAPGVTIGVHLLRWANPSHIRIGIAAFLVAFSIYSLARPRLKPVPESIAADMIVGLLSGMLGAVAGFPGILIVIWCGLRRWSKDEQRGVFQPASVAMLLMSAVALGVTGSVATGTIYLFLIGLPALLLGTWAGFALYGRINEEAFRKIVLWLLLAAGLFLLASLR